MQTPQHGVRGEYRNCSYTAANSTCTALLTMKTHRSEPKCARDLLT